MDEEFKLCWKNFQDNIASGFQNLYDRGDLVDVTLAVDGKLLHAHKIVLAICSPYFQEIFATNPCKHPTIILKDVTFNIMLELLEFMYQGVVNVKQAELQTFMKVGQLLQIKGLATNSTSTPASTSSEKSTSQAHNNADDLNHNNDGNTSSNIKPDDEKNNDNHNNNNNNNNSNNNNTESVENESTTSATAISTNKSNILNTNRTRSPNTLVGGTTTLPQQLNLKSENSSPLHHTYHAALKRQAEYGVAEVTSPFFSKKQLRRSASTTDQNSDLSDANESGTGMDSMSTDEFLLPTISMVESRYELNHLKRENSTAERDYRDGASAAAAAAAAASLRNSFGAPFGFDYNLYKSSNNANTSGGSGSSIGPQTEYPNELHMPNDYSKSFGNHMEIPSIAPGEHWFQGNLEFMLSQRGKPLLVHDGHTFGIQYVRKDKKYWQCNLSRKYNCKARVTTTETGDIIVTNNEHCHTEIRQHLRKDYQRQKVMMNALINLSNKGLENFRLKHHHQQITNSLSLQHLQQQQQQQQQQQLVNTTAAALSPLAAHSNATTTMQRFLDLAKFSPTDHAALNAVLQKQSDDSDENVPLDCGIRATLNNNNDVKAEVEKGISLIKNESRDNIAENNADNIDETSENLSPE